MKIDQVLLVEDHQDAMFVLNNVVMGVFNQPRIYAAKSIAEALPLIDSIPLDIALLDVGLPDGNGIELIDRIQAANSATMTVVTTIFDDDENLFNALRAGAAGYLLKGYTPDELKLYLEDLVNGKPALSPSIAHKVLEYFRKSDAGLATEVQGQEGNLTAREVEILSLVAKGCQTKEVAQILDISRNTVAHHIKSIYTKLNVHNRAQATAAAMKLNIIDQEDNR